MTSQRYFNIDKKKNNTYKKFQQTLNTLEQKLKQQQATVLSADKGPGLLIAQNTTVLQIYREYLKLNAHNVHPAIYIDHLNNIRDTLAKLNPLLTLKTNDDRVPTFYFKIKTHKDVFNAQPTKHKEIYTYNIGPIVICTIARPIVNHTNSITVLCSDILRPLISPIIERCKYLTPDIFKTIDALMAYGAPSQIYTGDIEKFYPSTPHTLIITAFHHYNTQQKKELQLLKELLKYNYLTDGKNFYHLGTKGIPMGLPLAPELARMCTAYLLRNYEPPIGEALTLYFDDVAATYPIKALPLKPFNLLPTTDNTTQDATYDTAKKDFCPCSKNTDKLSHYTPTHSIRRPNSRRKPTSVQHSEPLR